MTRYTVAGSVLGLAVLVALDPSAGFAGSAGPHPIPATLAATATAVTAPTATVLTSDRNPARLGKLVLLTARVTSGSGAPFGGPTGTVDVLDGVATVCDDVALDADGVASCQVRLRPDAHPLTAVYSGDADFSASSSAPLAQTVRDPGPAVRPGTIVAD
ncbi:MAG TPA: Ig-like domain-containing protein [Sporichthya sp.]|nr:Ig-like domain-containing protein [Sporichthya sp.]